MMTHHVITAYKAYLSCMWDRRWSFSCRKPSVSMSVFVGFALLECSRFPLSSLRFSIIFCLDVFLAGV